MKRYIVFSVMVFMLAGLVLAVGPTLAQEEDEVYPDATPVGDVSPQAALGTAFTYQGYLESGGSPVDDTCDLRFILFDREIGGSQVGTTQTVSEVVSNGLFTVELDFGASAFTGQARWLEIAVRCPAGSGSYSTLGRQALTATPYALYALSAPWSGLTGVPAGLDDGDDVGWSLTGNGGTTPGTNFLGTTDNKDLQLHVGSSRAFLLDYNATSPNLIGGYSGNWVTAGVKGATIGGGGESGSLNRVTDDHGTVGGGMNNQAGDNAGTTVDQRYATVGGGWLNTAIGYLGTIGGGYSNTVSSNYATVGGGYQNTASDEYATVGGGNHNIASQPRATVGGGYQNTASGINATIGGGYQNTASARYATVPGGYHNDAQGSASFAAGYKARANHDGAFVWGDYTGADIASNGSNQFIVRAGGGITLYSSSNLSTWASLRAGDNAWTYSSDGNLKENFAPVDGQEVLARLAEIPITTWNYKTAPSIRHMGPVAQDFAIFGLGNSELSINTIDADGVALAAIQGLYQTVQELKAENAALRQQLADLETRLAALEAAQRGGGR